jgi:hypothetical protein
VSTSANNTPPSVIAMPYCRQTKIFGDNTSTLPGNGETWADTLEEMADMLEEIERLQRSAKIG